MVSMYSKTSLQETINVLRTRKRSLVQKLKAKRDMLVLLDISKAHDQLSEYQKMNEDLRITKIQEAEFVYLRNML